MSVYLPLFTGTDEELHCVCVRLKTQVLALKPGGHHNGLNLSELVNKWYGMCRGS